MFKIELFGPEEGVRVLGKFDELHEYLKGSNLLFSDSKFGTYHAQNVSFKIPNQKNRNKLSSGAHPFVSTSTYSEFLRVPPAVIVGLAEIAVSALVTDARSV